jgi:hypothetical protein
MADSLGWRFRGSKMRGSVVRDSRKEISMTHPLNMEILPARLKKPERSFYLVWIIVTFLCVPMTYLLSLIILQIITIMVGDFVYVKGVQHITEDYLALYVFIPILSLLTGMLQYGLLRKYLPRIRGWVLATVAGWLLGVLLIVLPGWLGRIKVPLINFDLTLLMMGLAIGFTQWLVLRQRLPRAGWWIAANVLGWGLVDLITPRNVFDQYGLLGLGFLPACTTAVMLALHLNRVPSTEVRL